MTFAQFCNLSSNGAIVIAREQSEGQGRGNNQWTSPLGCALFNVYFDIDLQSLLGQRLSLLQLLASVAVLQAIERTPEYKALNVQIKWPNDIFIGNDFTKLGGILATSSISGNCASISLAQNYKIHDLTDMFRMQRYMCSRFFIDYKTIPEQMYVITQYVTTHFLPLSLTNMDETTNSILQYRDNNQQNIKTSYTQNNIINVRLCLLFFDHLSNVIQQSTVCLTHHDKEATLINIHHLKEYYHYNYEHLFIDDNYHQQRYHSHPHHYHHCSSSSSNSSRSSSPSSSSSNSYRYYRPNHNHRHQNSHYRHHNIQRQTANSLSYHHGSRNYSNDFHTNQQILANHHHHQRRHQS
ncbi:unnamed protein product [Rotaria sp. Silwood2]|nr:unnamed protein product [Rotaria sp. Silwood2]